MQDKFRMIFAFLRLLELDPKKTKWIQNNYKNGLSFSGHFRSSSVFFFCFVFSGPKPGFDFVPYFQVRGGFGNEYDPLEIANRRCFFEKPILIGFEHV